MSDKLTTDEMMTARRELTAKKLADLELKEESEGCAVSIHSGAVRISDAWGPTFESTGKWTVSDRVADVPGSFSDFHQAVDAAHAAKFGRTAELNEPITMPDEDRCETSQTDLQTAEIERNWNSVGWLQAELIKARDRIAKQATEAAEKRTAYNAEIDGLRAALAEAGALANKRGEEIARLTVANTAENQRPLATFDVEKRVWTVQVGILTVQVARVVDNVTAVIDGLGFLGSVTVKASAEHLIPLVGHMLSFCGIRVKE